MNRSCIRRVLATVATTALMALPASAALASPPAHANAGGNGNGPDRTEEEVTEDEDDTDEVGESLHASGSDRTDHQDARQGDAPSDPDGDGRGPDRDDTGVDKPGDDGGVYDGDQDGNNGCGNDQDFEDDNEGWCGRPDHSFGNEGQVPEPASDVEEIQEDEETTTEVAGDEQVEQTTDVLADVVVADTVADEADAPLDTVVLGAVAERPAADTAPSGDAAVLGTVADGTDTLPNAGASAVVLALTGLATLGTGTAMVRRRDG